MDLRRRRDGSQTRLHCSLLQSGILPSIFASFAESVDAQTDKRLKSDFPIKESFLSYLFSPCIDMIYDKSQLKTRMMNPLKTGETQTEWRLRHPQILLTKRKRSGPDRSIRQCEAITNSFTRCLIETDRIVLQITRLCKSRCYHQDIHINSMSQESEHMASAQSETLIGLSSYSPAIWHA
jgi:hypothetical protein